MSDSMFSAMKQSIVDGAPETAATLAEQCVSDGVAPLDAINQGYVPGMHFVGEQFGLRKMFLPDMMASAEAMRAAMNILDPQLKRMGNSRPCAGVVILGTVKGDIHEIGKCLVGTLLTAHGFRVHDLGADVSADKFVAAIRQHNPDLIGMSALLTTTMKNQRTVVEALDKEGLRSRVKVMVGGAPVTRQWAAEIGADAYGKDAVTAVAIARALMEGTPLEVLAEPQ